MLGLEIRRDADQIARHISLPFAQLREARNSGCAKRLKIAH